MKVLVFLACAFVCAYATTTEHGQLLGGNRCTWGPAYWCANITHAKSCGAVRHCIQTVWEHLDLPEDHDSVCDICVNMVTEARAQLQSNETQEELKQVFEGSCKLIPLKPIASECCSLVDEFIPELVETLASEMNPQVVCSVAGLCNNARIDKLLAEQEESRVKSLRSDQCDGCHSVVARIENNFRGSSKDQVLQGMLRVCGKLGSLSDGCTNIILTYFKDIYSHLYDNLNPEEVCLMAGVCFDQFHTHAEVTPLSNTGKIDVATKDDLPCDLCEQLVKHLRDLLVANTTELEFQRVLQGLCAQTKSFKDECRSLVDEYYPQIYNFLVQELDANSACVLMGICKGTEIEEGTMWWPMLPLETINHQKELLKTIEAITPKPKLVHVKIEKDETAFQRPDLMQLPIERMFPQTLTMVGNPELCTFCEYFLHFVQQSITEPKTVVSIKQAVDKACDLLPKSISSVCYQFVDTYGDAFVALLAQEIDPSQVCPLMSLCPPPGLQEVEIFMHSKPQDKPNCPLCLFAVSQLEEMIKNGKTEEKIRTALKSVCVHLPRNLAPECQDFVDTYADELVEMLVADLSPQQVCVYLKLCDDKPPKSVHPLIHSVKSRVDGIYTNEIADNTFEGKHIHHLQPQKELDHSDQSLITAEVIKVSDRNPQCVICEFIMSKIEEEMKDKSNEDEIKKIVHSICNVLPKTVADDCNNFVDKYADMVIQLLINTANPEEICSMIELCKDKILKMSDEITECAICESLISTLAKLMDNPNIDHRMEHVLKKACVALPTQYHKKCDTMIDVYGDSFFELISEVSDGQVICTKVGLCQQQQRMRYVRSAQLVGTNKCTYGPSYWCKSLAASTECDTHQYCNEKVWKGNPPSS